MLQRCCCRYRTRHARHTPSLYVPQKANCAEDLSYYFWTDFFTILLDNPRRNPPENLRRSVIDWTHAFSACLAYHQCPSAVFEPVVSCVSLDAVHAPRPVPDTCPCPCASACLPLPTLPCHASLPVGGLADGHGMRAEAPPARYQIISCPPPAFAAPCNLHGDSWTDKRGLGTERSAGPSKILAGPSQQSLRSRRRPSSRCAQIR